MKSRRLYAVLKLNVRLVLGALLVLGLCGAALITVGAAAAEKGVDIPVVMYHAVLKDKSRRGKYVIAPAEFENDVNWLTRQGYTTVLIEDLIAYTKGGELPEKPILLTFDDGYYNNYLYAFETAKQYKCKFVISPIGRYTDLYSETGEENAYYSHATWKELREMADSGLVEVQNHSYDLHNSDGGRLGVKRLSGESAQAYETLLREDLGKAQDAIETNVGKRPTAFVYPFGAISRDTPELVKSMGFSATLTCEEKISKITRDPESLFGLGRYLRVSGISSETFFQGKMGL